MGFGSTADVVGGEWRCGFGGYGSVVCDGGLSVCDGAHEFWAAGKGKC